MEWLAVFKKIKIKLGLSNDIDMLLMVEKYLRGGTCHSIYWYAKASNKCLEDYNKNKELPYIQFIWLGNVARASSK